MFRWMQQLWQPASAVHALPPAVLLRDGRSLVVRGFSPFFADTIAGWLADRQDARWAAPQTGYPVHGADVLAWVEKSDHPFLGFLADDPTPVVYGEVNSFQDKNGNESWIGHLTVAPARRGQGVGRAFCQALLHFAVHTLRQEAVSLVVFPDNTSAVTCYQQVGFQITGTEHKTFAGLSGEHELVRMVWKTGG